jgi:hypothetical protein
MNAHAGAEPLPSWLSQDLYPFASRYAEIAGARVHYVDEGTGPPLLLHGNPTWSFLYREIILGSRLGEHLIMHRARPRRRDRNRPPARADSHAGC